MPVSHLTLTVSHLPTSTSFFLSCLQPLGYKFIGRHDEYIGFGSKADEPADFWLAQEQPGTPAGAAHIAFPAPTKEAVNTFFISALKAGGKIHGEPKLRDPETGYFSAAVVDFDGNSIEAVYRPDQTTTNIKNGSSVVSSRARSIRTTTETRAVVQTAIENIPPARVKMLDQQPQPQQQAYQQSYAPTQQQSDNAGNGISAKTIIGTLLGATAGAALAYAMIKGDSTSASSQTNSQSSPSPAPAPSQYAQQQLPPQQLPLQQPQQPQPHQMSMSLPMLMPMLGPYQDQQQQQQQPVYRALEAPPPPSMAASQAARSTYTANDAISAYTRSTAPNKSKSPRADTIYEETEYYPPITDDGIARSLYSQESSSNAASGTGTGTGSGVRRTSNGSIYATRELPIRAIEYSSSEMMSVASSQNSQSSQAKVRSQSYPCDPSTFISSFAETQQQYQNRHQQQGRIIGEAPSDFSSISTIKPAKSVSLSAHRSVASSQHPRSSKSSTTSKHSSHRHEDIDNNNNNNNNNNGSTTSSSTARKISLPDSRPGSTYTYTSSTSKRSSTSNTSTIKDIKRDIDAYEIPLPASVAAPSTVFLDAVVDIAPEDSISQVGINPHHHRHSSADNKSSSGRSHRSRSGPSAQQSHVSVSTSASKREKKEGSKFDQPVRPSDSISQVSSNHSHRQHHSSSHSSHHSSGGHKASSRVSGTPSKKSHSGGSRSGIY